MGVVAGQGSGADEVGVSGDSALAEGVVGVSHATHRAGVRGINDNATDNAGVGVHGSSAATGVFGESTTWHGVFGSSTAGGAGVAGEGETGVMGTGRSWIGVFGETHGTENGPAGVWGEGHEGGAGVKGHTKRAVAGGVEGYHLAETGDGGPGVLGSSKLAAGVRGEGQTGVMGVAAAWLGVYGETNAPPEAGAAGVWGEGKGGGDGVKGVANAPGKAAVCGFQLGNNGPGVFGQGNPAGQFVGRVLVDGDLEVTGDVLLTGADYAETFSAVDAGLETGTVVVIGPDGDVEPCSREYDPAVAGVVSGAGGVRPGVILDRQQVGVTIALMGKVWCLADGDLSPIAPGDLLASSATPGHARRLDDVQRTLGTVIGKALTPLPSGRGLVRVLVAGR